MWSTSSFLSSTTEHHKIQRHRAAMKQMRMNGTEHSCLFSVIYHSHTARDNRERCCIRCDPCSLPAKRVRGWEGGAAERLKEYKQCGEETLFYPYIYWQCSKYPPTHPTPEFPTSCIYKYVYQNIFCSITVWRIVYRCQRVYNEVQTTGIIKEHKGQIRQKTSKKPPMFWNQILWNQDNIVSE